MQRRFFLRQTTTGAATAAASPLIGLASSLRAEADHGKSVALIDTHVTLDRWPFARMGPDSPDAAVKLLRENGVVQAWAGSFDALLHENLDAVNDRLAAISKSHSIFQPMGAVNPKARSWKRTLSRCAEAHRMRGIRLHPDFHGYQLDDPAFIELLDVAAAKGVLVQISVGLNSKKRPLPSRISVDKVDLTRLSDVVTTSHRIQLLGVSESIRSAKRASELAAKGIHFETATGTEKWIASIPADQVHFGSGSPLKKFAPLDPTLLSAAQFTAISSHNAENLMLQA